MAGRETPKKGQGYPETPDLANSLGSANLGFIILQKFLLHGGSVPGAVQRRGRPTR